MLNCILISCLFAGAYADLRTPKNSGVIVNPFYDPKDDVNDIKKSDRDVMLPPTHQQLSETFNLRNIINNAVRSNLYAVRGADTTPQKPKKPMLPWLSFLLESKSGKNILGSDGDEVLGSQKNVNGSDDSIVVADQLPNNEASEIKSNLIDSIVVSRLESVPFSIPQKKVQREQLELISIEEDANFLHGHNIRSWITIEPKTSDKKGLIGITNSSLVLVADANGKYELVEELDLKTRILCFTNYMHWNQTSRSYHGIIILEILNQLMFISTRDDLSGLDIVWQWTIHSSLDSLFYFKHEASDMMLMINSPVTANVDEDARIAADIYRFDLQSRHTWLIQKIPLNNPCKSVAAINTYREQILCFSQNNTVQLYKREQHVDGQAFKYFSSIEANNVRTVSAFQMGGYSYLATTGLEPKIFRYHRGNFVAQTILSRRWGLVEVIFPIPARTYRDDLILLVQHRIMMGTHTVAVVEALIWDGEAFDASLSVPCKMGNEIIDFGMSCLLDYDRDAGIDGLSIIQTGNSIALIVPRVEAPSSMFRLTFELTSFDSPSSAAIKDFAISSKYVEETTNYQNDILAKGTDALTGALASIGSRNDVSAVWNLSMVTTDNLIVNDDATWKIDEIYFGSDRRSENDLKLDIEQMMSTLQELKRNIDLLEGELVQNDIVGYGPDSSVQNILPAPTNGKFDMKTARVIKGERRVKRSAETDRQMQVDKLNVKHLVVEYINDIPIENIIFTQNGVLNSINYLVVEDIFNVSHDGIAIPDRMETVGDSIEEKTLWQQLKPDDNIHVAGDLIIDSINGVVWEDFIQQIVLRNLPNLIHDLRVNGDVIAKGSIQVDTLNGISFPNDFLWMHDTDISIVTGQKAFKETLTADSVDTSGTVDGIFTQETISLAETHHIRGLTTFTQLEVTESLNVNGTVNGKHLDDFKPNLSLLQSNIISSDCIFQNLQVQGPIFILNHFNGLILDDILSDVVYKSNPKSIISSFKTFESVESNVELTSNLLNSIPIGDYMTTDTEQDINFDHFIGNIMIRELYTNGLFDFINVTELDINSIKLMGEQFTEAELIFESDDEINVDAEVIEIQRSFNGLTLTDLIRVDESLEINGNVVINTALISDLVISGEVNGNGIVNGINLNEFDLTRFSRTRSQDVTSMYLIENVRIDNEVVSTFVNGVDIDDLRKLINRLTNLPEFLSSSDLRINNLVIDGSVLVHTVNGHDFNSIRDNAIWLNQPNIVNGELEFLEGFEIGQGIIVNNLNNEIFEHFLNGLVLKTDEYVEFIGPKIFQNGFHVEGDIQANTLNGILTGNIWTKGSTKPINGTVNVIGNLFVQNVNLQGSLNSVYWSQIENKYRFDVESSAHVLTSDVQIISTANINDLHILQGVNSVGNITEFLLNVVRKNDDGRVDGNKKFQSNLHFMDHLQVGIMDTFDVTQFFDDLVINDANQKAIITGDVVFEDDVTTSHIHVSNNILTSSVMDCSLTEWDENALNVNSQVKIFQQLIFPTGTFQSNNIELQFLNGNSMATIFTLNSDQSFEHSLLSDLDSSSQIHVQGMVNGLEMKAVLDDAVSVTGDNHITAATSLQSARVLNALSTVDTINGLDLNNVATLHEDLHFHGPLSFQRIRSRSISTKDTISGIDFDYWHANALWKSQRENQIVSGKWTVSEGIFHSGVKGDATLNGISMDALAGRVNAHQPNVLNNLKIFNEGYVENCHKVTHLIQSTQTLPYFLTHFEESFSLRVQNVINSVHFFEANGRSYLVLNLGCLTVLYVWNTRLEIYEKFIEVQTGNVDSWLDMLDEANVMHLISNTEVERSNCPTSGLNIWKFDGSSLVHVSKIAESNKFAILYKNKLHPQLFLAMTKDDSVVNAFDLQNNLVEQWHLPIHEQQFRFVPENANIGIALCNGKQLSSLSFTKLTDNRKERSTNPAEVANDMEELKRLVRCPFLNEKLENATASCNLWHQAKFKSMSKIGPHKKTDRTTLDRLLEDVKMSNSQLGSPFILTGSPFERKAKNISDFLSTSSKNGQSLPAQSVAIGTDSTAENPPWNNNESTSRDAFGVIEKVIIDATDNIVDSLIELDADNEDVEFDDSSVGSSPMNEGRVEPEPSATNQSQSSTSRDIEAKTIKLADKVADVFDNSKNSAKESQAKLHNLFQPVNNDHRKSEVNSDDEKIENKSLPKIPTVLYMANDSNLRVTQSPVIYGADDTTTNTVVTTDSTSSSKSTASKEHLTTANFLEEGVGEEEPQISNEISSEGIATAENVNFPNHPAEEIVVIPVGETKKHLVAVSSLQQQTIQGKHDSIRIYEDIIEGNLFQTLICHRPRSLTVLNIRDESILAFIENDAAIQIFVYRGIQGFVKFTSFEFPSFIYKLTSIYLPVANPFACAKSYLAVALKKEIHFVEAKTCGFCGVNAQLSCDGGD